MPSLREIQQTVSTLWLNKQARTWLVKRHGARPSCLEGASDETLDSASGLSEGLQLYAELLDFGHQDVMASIYPYCRQLLGKKWETVVADYLLKFPPDHYNFNRLCSRFSQYCTIYGGTLSARWPFLSELADYEWIELEKLEQDASIQILPHQPLSNLTLVSSTKPILNPTVTVRDYKYNVIAIADKLERGKRVLKIVAERTLVAVYRDARTNQCQYVELGEAAAGIVEQARSQPSYQQLIPLFVALTPGSDPQAAMLQFLELVEELQEWGIFVGSLPV